VSIEGYYGMSRGVTKLSQKTNSFHVVLDSVQEVTKLCAQGTKAAKVTPFAGAAQARTRKTALAVRNRQKSPRQFLQIGEWSRRTRASHL
jgi:hypothetical protein